MQKVVIGAGFTGIAAAWTLHKAGHSVIILESSKKPGGLASGFKASGWNWSLEYHYHHIFASDDSILNLVSEMGLSHLISFRTTLTGVLRDNRISLLDSPISLLQVPFLTVLDKVRVGFTLLFLRVTNFWRILEKFTATNFLKKTMGVSGYQNLWEPLLVGKFGRYATKINAAWFWARIKARTKRLGYFDNGFEGLASAMVSKLESNGVKIYYGSQVTKIDKRSDGQVTIHYQDKNGLHELTAGQVLLTLSSNLVTKLVDTLPTKVINKLKQLKYLSAVTVVLELEKPLFIKKWYWLNVNDPLPFLAVVEHTNFIDTIHYGNKSIVYIGKYLSNTDPLYMLSDEEIASLFIKNIKKIPQTNVIKVNRYWVHRAPFAQPVVEIEQSKHLPPEVIWPGKLFWTSMQHVYPWDRGTNFAVKAGVEMALKMETEQVD